MGPISSPTALRALEDRWFSAIRPTTLCPLALQASACPPPSSAMPRNAIHCLRCTNYYRYALLTVTLFPECCPKYGGLSKQSASTNWPTDSAFDFKQNRSFTVRSILRRNKITKKWLDSRL